MDQYVKKIFHIMDKIMESMSALILGGMTILIFCQVLARYIFKTPLAWSEEGARFLFIWMTFIAGYVGARKGQHIGVELLQNMLPKSIKKGMQILSDLLTTGFFLIVLYYCCKGWSKLGVQISPALKIPMSFVYLGMMIGCLGMAICYFFHIFAVLKKEEKEGLA